ncbi:MAG: DUF427 domain-containing protein [Streptosporangiales bacterium]|nr:DUF427 domain-containing protein [Streptosporangiales bacterium]
MLSYTVFGSSPEFAPYLHRSTTAGGGRSVEDMDDSELRVEPSPKRVRAYLAGRLVADTRRASLVWEIPWYPAYYIPADDVTASLTPAEEADLYNVEVAGAVALAAARRFPESEQRRGLVRLEWGAMSHWLEEDEPVYTHPRDPHKRVDILTSSRHVRIEAGGVTLAESSRPSILFETGLPPRYYLPLPDVRTELLTPSDTVSHCPYKGTAAYWSLMSGDGKNIAWTYRSPLPESQKVAGLVCFYDEKTDVYLDGELQERPRTHFA